MSYSGNKEAGGQTHDRARWREQGVGTGLRDEKDLERQGRYFGPEQQMGRGIWGLGMNWTEISGFFRIKMLSKQCLSWQWTHSGMPRLTPTSPYFFWPQCLTITWTLHRLGYPLFSPPLGLIVLIPNSPVPYAPSSGSPPKLLQDTVCGPAEWKQALSLQPCIRRGAMPPDSHLLPRSWLERLLHGHPGFHPSSLNKFSEVLNQKICFKISLEWNHIIQPHYTIDSIQSTKPLLSS